ncbi:MAG TPA: tetratricopeptide repeat protein [Polyangiaceae bacterium]
MKARSVSVLALLLVGCGGAAGREGPLRPAAPPLAVPAAAAAAKPPLEAGEEHLRASEYPEAERRFRAELSGPNAVRAALGLAETLLLTGRYDEAVATARKVPEGENPAALRARTLEALAKRSAGDLAGAEQVLAAAARFPAARDAKLLLGEVLIERGKREAARAPLLAVIDDYNEERIAKDDGHGFALVGRAAHLLRSARDANDAFGEAEATGVHDQALLLWRAELFLEKYDPGHAEEVLRDVFERAPQQPQALVLLARVRLDQAFDFVEAERLARAALAINPKLASAYFVLAGIALRDMEPDLAHRHIADGLAARPGDLDLLSMRAAVHFVTGDRKAFDADKRAVFTQNPEYSRLYAIVGEFADWEHRYDEIVVLMQEATGLDPDDPVALASLGVNLIRAGDDQRGTQALSRAFAVDPFNARVFNTLELFDKVIPKQYVTVKGTRFTLRYHARDRAVLERYVPALLEKAWTTLVQHYGFTPKTPVGVELYADREHFAVRTSGLPETAIQGVCFGHTLASLSPQKETFNLGMTLWHELSHVFHIQLSDSRVPRWFTEGLAEYETALARPEWSREQDPELFELRRAGRLPTIEGMNRAFTRAEQLSDMAAAYYASSRLVALLGERHGMQKLAAMLRLWAQNKRTGEVFRGALGVAPAEEDARFGASLDAVLARYSKQFVPTARSGSVAAAAAAAQREPKDPGRQTALALALLRSQKLEEAQGAIARARALDPRFADARFLTARIALATDKPQEAVKELRAMLGDGQDGYAVQMLLVEAAEATQDEATRLAALQAAERLDPTQVAPLYGLLQNAEKKSDADGALALLRRLAALSEHDAGVYRELLTRLVARREFAEAVRVGEAAVNVDMMGFETHFAYAQALAGTGDKRRAKFEFESALLCDADPVRLAAARSELKALGNPGTP